jgi:hypothetical protein
MCAPVIEKLFKHMTEASIRDELEALHIHVQAVIKFRTRRQDQNAEKNCTFTQHFILWVALGPHVGNVSSLTDLGGLLARMETFNCQKGPLQCIRCQAFGQTQPNCGCAPECVACGDAHRSGRCVTPNKLKCYSCRGNLTANSWLQ